MADLEHISTVLRGERADILSKSLADAITWCANPDVPSKMISDQHWLGLFSGVRPVTELDAHKFIVTFQLARMRNWDKPKVAEVINAFIANSDFDPARDIKVFAKDLGDCITSKNGAPQTSAATKIAMFAKPAADVFIWDQLASRAARLRQWEVTGGRVNISALYKDADGAHDYPAYMEGCASAWKAEMAKDDFLVAVDAFIAAVEEAGGPMSDRSVAPRAFMERRLLDKLLFWEGHKARAQLSKSWAA